MRKFFSPAALWPDQSIAAIRILFGLLLIYHGKEIFQPELMKSYTDWEAFKGPNGLLLAYIGKTAEFVAGVSLFLGLFTRIGAVICIGTLTYVTFFIGQGRFWYEDQHPFMFVMMGLVFFFYGPGAWSVDGALFATKKPF
ncbi:MAG: DoxX family protein [Bacteroidetes bacterium]|nr:MAG: DoxX family protein [Bacteroidota bacterium]